MDRFIDGSSNGSMDLLRILDDSLRILDDLWMIYGGFREWNLFFKVTILKPWENR